MVGQIACKLEKLFPPFQVRNFFVHKQMPFTFPKPSNPANQADSTWRRVLSFLTRVLVKLAAIGFNVETVTYKNIKFQVWDLGGQTSIRPYWRCYYPNTQVGLTTLNMVNNWKQPDRPGTRSTDKSRSSWPEDQRADMQAIIYVVDSSDTERIGTSAEEFHAILDEEELRDALILVYANKQVDIHVILLQNSQVCADFI